MGAAGGLVACAVAVLVVVAIVLYALLVSVADGKDRPVGALVELGTLPPPPPVL